MNASWRQNAQTGDEQRMAYGRPRAYAVCCGSSSNNTEADCELLLTDHLVTQDSPAGAMSHAPGLIYTQWPGADPGICVRGSLLFSSLPPLSLFPLASLVALPLKAARGSGERCKLPYSGVRGRAPAENEFGALLSCQKATGGNHFEYLECHVLQ